MKLIIYQKQKVLLDLPNYAAKTDLKGERTVGIQFSSKIRLT